MGIARITESEAQNTRQAGLGGAGTPRREAGNGGLNGRAPAVPHPVANHRAGSLAPGYMLLGAPQPRELGVQLSDGEHGTAFGLERVHLREDPA
jgi:hypothetical protein